MPRRDFGRYKIVEEIGRGAMGVVYRGNDPVIGRAVAVKVVNVAYLEEVGVAAEEYYRRFQREAEVAGRLNHPSIVKIYDRGQDYIVMEFVEGQSLAALIQGRVPMSLSRMLQIVGHVAEALDYAHAEGIVHRDVKPANIMIRPDGQVKVMDFGLARIESSTLTKAGEILGSASYMAPEIIKGQPADALCDIYALGVVVYELMTGGRPFGGGSVSAIIQRVVKNPPTSAHSVNLNVPPDYDSIFMKVLAKDPADRYHTASEFADDLMLKKWADKDPTMSEGAKAQVPTEGARKGDEGPTLAKLAEPQGVPPNQEEAPEQDPTVLAVNLEELVGDPSNTVPLIGPPETKAPPPAGEEPLASLVSAVPPPTVVAPPQGPRPVAAPKMNQPSRGPRLLWLGVLSGALVLAIASGITGAYYLIRKRPPEAPSVSAPPSLEPTTLSPHSPEPSPEASPSPSPASLSITSTPSGAKVSLGSGERGTTPYNVAIPAGRVSVVVEKDGFRRWTGEVTLSPGGNRSVQAELEPVPKATATRAAPAKPVTPKATSVKPGDLVPIGPDVTPPKRIAGDASVVPPSRPKEKGSVSVLIEFVVNEDGSVSQVQVAQSGGDAVDRACLKAVSGWRYTPANLKGTPVKVRQQAKFTFEYR